MQWTGQIKGIVEAGVRYVKYNALQGRAEELTTWPDYQELAVRWRDEVANLRLHQATGQRPVDRFGVERPCLRGLPPLPFDTDEIVAAVVNSHARVRFDGNRYSVPPDYLGKPVMIRAGDESVRVIHEGREIARHQRCYARGKRICQSEHKLQALQRRQRNRGHHLEGAFDALGEVAREFHLKLQTRPVKTTRHLRRLLNLVRDLATLKLSRIAEIYREVLDRAARKNSSTLEVLSTLMAEEAIARSERALGRRIRQARLPKRKTLEEYDFTFPKRMPKQKILRLFDCQFIEQHLCGIFIGPTGTGATGARSSTWTVPWPPP